ncbi:MAG: zinc ribbon domain-containing protein [candidate division Zixibacteria bacterium]|nr:zinc ribbon domain-containing protein [candidate division Zixibacteria bacterium]
MPLYEYKCNQCGHEFEELVYGDKKPACPKCNSDKTEKKMSAFATGGGSTSGGTSGASCNNFT